MSSESWIKALKSKLASRKFAPTAKDKAALNELLNQQLPVAKFNWWSLRNILLGTGTVALIGTGIAVGNSIFSSEPKANPSIEQPADDGVLQQSIESSTMNASSANQQMEGNLSSAPLELTNGSSSVISKSRTANVENARTFKNSNISSPNTPNATVSKVESTDSSPISSYQALPESIAQRIDENNSDALLSTSISNEYELVDPEKLVELNSYPKEESPSRISAASIDFSVSRQSPNLMRFAPDALEVRFAAEANQNLQAAIVPLWNVNNFQLGLGIGSARQSYLIEDSSRPLFTPYPHWQYDTLTSWQVDSTWVIDGIFLGHWEVDSTESLMLDSSRVTRYDTTLAPANLWANHIYFPMQVDYRFKFGRMSVLTGIGLIYSNFSITYLQGDTQRKLQHQSLIGNIRLGVGYWLDERFEIAAFGSHGMRLLESGPLVATRPTPQITLSLRYSFK